MYVLQVPGGHEKATRGLLMNMLGEKGLIGECFVPLFEAMRRRNGEWGREKRLLFPGYVFVTTNKIVEVAQSLRSLPFFAKVIGGRDEKYLPLSDEEVAWLQALTDVDSHTVELSTGVIEGDQVKIWKGPLKGQEALIKKIDRHKRLAFVEMHILGRTKLVKVGLEIVSKA
ncbi:antiterminator LoaP [Collinsella ihumii]|uniref:Antiterminator LoaP n=1 Tax=Collinsella ihumii TaxID=1720204 RepID=A0AAW7JRZ2_9ACTN|nr:antiterminator LoaP [Collinsella ihumii]MDN0069534.1 antiterminator LoaP [Collinsella ihumii]